MPICAPVHDPLRHAIVTQGHEFYKKTEVNAIYVHAGVPWNGERWLHPREVEPATPLLWLRTRAFFTDYRGKTMVVGHTTTGMLPPELSNFTPEDPTDLWAGPCVYALDTGAGKGGFLTALELPALHVYESRRAAQ